MARNANQEHHQSLSFNERIALFITTRVGTMSCAYAFAVLALVALPAALTSGNLVLIIAWLSQAFLQLVLLPLIIVGQNLQSRHSERRAEIDFETNVKAEREIRTLNFLIRGIDKKVDALKGGR